MTHMGIIPSWAFLHAESPTNNGWHPRWVNHPTLMVQMINLPNLVMTNIAIIENGHLSYIDIYTGFPIKNAGSFHQCNKLPECRSITGHRSWHVLTVRCGEFCYTPLRLNMFLLKTIPSGNSTWFNIAKENHHFQWLNPLFLWSCSIAMLVLRG